MYKRKSQTSPICSVVVWKFLTLTVIFTVKMFSIDVYHPSVGMSTCQRMFDCLLTYMSACLSVPVSTSILPPVSLSLCLPVSSFPFCSLPVCLWRLAFIQVLLISATSYRLERNPFSEMSAACLKATHTANIYVMIVDSAHRETESSLPSLCSM